MLKCKGCRHDDDTGRLNKNTTRPCRDCIRRINQDYYMTDAEYEKNKEQFSKLFW